MARGEKTKSLWEDQKYKERMLAKLVKRNKENPAWKGKKRPDESKRMKGKKRPEMTGEKHFAWKGGDKKLRYVQRLEKIAGRKKPDQCEICGAMGNICFDHDHKTGKFRGWICKRCNTAIGMAMDNSELLIAMSEYLKKHHEN